MENQNPATTAGTQTNQSLLSSLWNKYANFLITMILLFLICFGIEYKFQLAQMVSDDVRSLVFTVIGLTLCLSGFLFSLISSELITRGWIVDNFTSIKNAIRITLFAISMISGIYVAERFAKESTLGISLGFFSGLVGAGFIVAALVFKIFKQKKFFKLPTYNQSNDSYKKFDKWLELKNGVVSVFLEKFDEFDNSLINQKLQDEDMWHLGLAKGLSFMSEDRWELLISKLDEVSLAKIINCQLLRSYLTEHPSIALQLLHKKALTEQMIAEETELLNRIFQGGQFDLVLYKKITTQTVKRMIGERLLLEMV